MNTDRRVRREFAARDYDALELNAGRLVLDRLNLHAAARRNTGRPTQRKLALIAWAISWAVTNQPPDTTGEEAPG